MSECKGYYDGCPVEALIRKLPLEAEYRANLLRLAYGRLSLGTCERYDPNNPGICNNTANQLDEVTESVKIVGRAMVTVQNSYNEAFAPVDAVRKEERQQQAAAARANIVDTDDL